MRTSQRVRVVQRVSWATYDRYLKSNRVSEGLASYDAAIVLILAGLPESRHVEADSFCQWPTSRICFLK